MPGVNTILSWYSSKPAWAKVLLFVVLVLGLALSIVWYVLGRAVGINGSAAPLAERLQREAEKSRSDQEDRDRKAIKQAKAEADKRREIDKKISELKAENKRKHDNVKSNGTATDLVDQWNRKRKRND